MFTSYIFSFKTSIYSKKIAINLAFIYPLYRERINIIYRVFYIATLCTFTARSQRHFHLISTYLVMHILDLHLC